MKNKKKLILILLGVAVLVFVGLYLYINYSEPNILNSDDKKWISDNGGKVIDIDVVNDIPIYANNGKGVVFDFLNYVTEKTNLEFNKIPYLKEGGKVNSKYRVEIVDGTLNLNNNQLLIFNDTYVSIAKTDIKINCLNDLEGNTLGILESDSSNIKYYLENVPNVKYKTYETIDDLFKGMEENEVNMVIALNIMNLDRTIKGDYVVNYYFNSITKNIVLTLDSDNKNLNSILTKAYNRWFDEEYVKDYNETMLNYYITMIRQEQIYFLKHTSMDMLKICLMNSLWQAIWKV